jgi:hypothetical protein
MYCCAVKSPVTTTFPFIVWFPLNVLDPVVAPPPTLPSMLARNVPVTVKSPVIIAEPDTIREPVTTGSNMFISYKVLYLHKYYKKFILTKKNQNNNKLI